MRLFPLPSTAHLLPRFSLRSQHPELSVDAPMQLYSRIDGFLYDMLFIQHLCTFVKNFFAPLVDKVSIPGQLP